MEWLVELSKYIITPAVFIAAVAWLIKSLTSQYLSKDIEAYKSELEKESLKFRVQFESMHHKRAEVLSEFYKKLSMAERAFHVLMAPFQPAGSNENKNVKDAAIKAQEMQDYFFDNKIYFDETTADSIDKIMDKFRAIYIDFDTVLLKKNDLKEDYVKDWHKTWGSLKNDIPKEKAKLEAIFRSLLGVEN